MWLSILIPTLDDRREQFDRIYGKLNSQIQRDGLEGEVEILYLRDDGSEPIGVKRNRLMVQAQGQFMVFVDDDDDVHDRYVTLIVSELKEHPEVDALGIWGEITFRGENPRRFIMSARYKDYKTRNGTYTRPPHHLNPIRTEIARRYEFEPVSRDEDADRALRMSKDGVLRKEQTIDEILYYYLSRRWWTYQVFLDRTEWIRHPLGLLFVNRLRARRWLRTQTFAWQRRKAKREVPRERTNEPKEVKRTLAVGDAQTGNDTSVYEIGPSEGWPKLCLAEVWHHLEIGYLLLVRDIKVRYKQSAVGIGWAILQPLLMMGIFTILFDRFLKVPTGGVPYPLLAMCALVPWTYFSHALNKSTISLVVNHALITKVYFPRLVVPLAAVLGGLVDFFIAFGLLLIMLLFYGVTISVSILTLPFFLLLGVLTALGCGLWLSALNVQYRDIVNALPFMTQVMMFVTPVAYSSALVPEKWRMLYAMNPMASVVDGFRWALLGETFSPGWPCVASIVVVLVLLISGLFFFRFQEDRFADVV